MLWTFSLLLLGGLAAAARGAAQEVEPTPADGVDLFILKKGTNEPVLVAEVSCMHSSSFGAGEASVLFHDAAELDTYALLRRR